MTTGSDVETGTPDTPGTRTGGGTDTETSLRSLSALLSRAERYTSRRLDAVLVRHDLTPDRWRTLDLLSDGHGRTMSELAERLLVPGPTMTKIVDRLTDAALVYRAVDERDRRRVVVRISDAGQETLAALQWRVDEVEREVLADLDDDAPALLELLARLGS
ncbi:MarR family winged helix-turn-helix transcriptional regulator [Pseudonocardia phyllosphaerae]|uniref:MarR family winged helix-turn-helix transcriptional regulator n=1 Tax=Pseudonocardia phyllosphaerae TaxID=3390502 RepID=UPI00397B8A83